MIKRSIAGAFLIASLASLPSQTALAVECSVEAQGQSVYAVVKKKVREKFSEKDNFAFSPYDQASITLTSDCKFHIKGRFQFSAKGQVKRKIYDATMTPKPGAPDGMKILSYEILNG